MYSIFAPLDPDEPLPRELLLEAKRHRTVGRREVAGMVWIPALFVILSVVDWIHGNGLVLLVMLVLLLTGLTFFALSEKR
jgi:hypothetical protein